MSKKSPFSYFLMIILLLILLSLPQDFSEQIRGSSVAAVSPSWELLGKMQKSLSANATVVKTKTISAMEELQKLQIENRLLRNELVQLKEAMQREWHLLNQLTAVQKSDELDQTALSLKKRHQLQIKKIMALQLQATPAKIIFRSLSSWNSSLWVNLGESSNLLFGKKIIAKNSPVVVGTAVVGVVDYVGKSQSRVRLITDSGLSPSVRVKREQIDASLFREKLLQLLQLLEKTENPGDYDILASSLKSALTHVTEEDNALYLAKGEIQGTSKPLWRSARHLLNGHGFNYDYADGEGPARDLRTGQLMGAETGSAAMPILKAGDLLVTTGMDGVFPSDLLVAQVVAVSPLKEGDYFYELEALPAAGNLDDLTVVFVLPPSEYDTEDQPHSF